MDTRIDKTTNAKSQILRHSTATGRWARLGPYYAMFPLDFALDIIEKFSSPDASVLDPFCGRGTVPVISQSTGRRSVGIDVNPVAFVFSAAKTDPEPNPTLIISRVNEIASKVTPHDEIPENEFQTWAWSPEVLGFLRVARQMLDWTHDRRDRTLMAILLVHLHGKLGSALSNQMRQTKGMAPNYSVRWWKSRNMLPPKIEVRAYLADRTKWRYKYGIVSGPSADIRLGDARKALNGFATRRFDLLLTSPPYYDVTNYRLDHWIRLWLLGGPALPDGDTTERYANKEKYRTMLHEVFASCKKLLTDDATIYIRTDSREFTLNTTLSIVRNLWPEREVYWRSETNITSQTALFGDHAPKPGETDILVPARGMAVSKQFSELNQGESNLIVT